MADIQKCSGVAQINGEVIVCEARNNYYRFTAPPSDYQAWGPVGSDFTKAGCGMFIPLYLEIK